MTTMSVIGYGDLYPITVTERLVSILILLIGYFFFSFIMGSFIEIIQNMKTEMGPEDRTFDLHNWITLLTRFQENRPLAPSLYR
jgi:hypothetical protein